MLGYHDLDMALIGRKARGRDREAQLEQKVGSKAMPNTRLRARNDEGHRYEEMCVCD